MIHDRGVPSVHESHKALYPGVRSPKKVTRRLKPIAIADRWQLPGVVDQYSKRMPELVFCHLLPPNA